MKISKSSQSIAAFEILARLNRAFGRGRRRKLKGTAHVKLPSGNIRLAELHWYEAHGIGRRNMKIKLPFLD